MALATSSRRIGELLGPLGRQRAARDRARPGVARPQRLTPRRFRRQKKNEAESPCGRAPSTPVGGVHEPSSRMTRTTTTSRARARCGTTGPVARGAAQAASSNAATRDRAAAGTNPTSNPVSTDLPGILGPAPARARRHGPASTSCSRSGRLVGIEDNNAVISLWPASYETFVEDAASTTARRNSCRPPSPQRSAKASAYKFQSSGNGDRSAATGVPARVGVRGRRRVR